MRAAGGMQDWQLRVSHLIDHAERECGSQEIVTRWSDGRIDRTDWAGIAHDARRLAGALVRLGMQPGDRIATLAMNHAPHLTAWYGVIGMGGVVHTLNVRLFDDQLVYIINHAQDRVLLYDRVFQATVDRLRPQLPTVEHFIAFDGDGWPALLEPEDGHFVWHHGDERDPCMLCYTSGTTGDPKGVLYEHRSTMLHAMAEIAPGVFNLSARSVLLPIVPMFHAASWGLPFAGAAAGVKFVFSVVNEPAVLHKLMNDEAVTHSAGVPTVWLGLFAYLDALNEMNGRYGFGPLKLVTIGGSAAPRLIVERLMMMGIDVNHAWGMTETSPIGTMGSKPANWNALNHRERVDVMTRQGRVPFGVELRAIGDDGTVLPRDGITSGRLEVRGPWVVKRYYLADTDAVEVDGWFDTGDVAVLHPDGTMQITDRVKDVIKSGGEWISSVELENAAVGCPGVAEAAAIAVVHPRWDERPLLLVVRKPGTDVSADDVMKHLSGAVAKWWLPDEVKFVDSLPHTGTGKILKSALRDQWRDYRFDDAA